MVEFTRRFTAHNGASLWFSDRVALRERGLSRDTVTVTTDHPDDVEPDFMGWSVDAEAACELAKFFWDLTEALDKDVEDPLNELGEEVEP